MGVFPKSFPRADYIAGVIWPDAQASVWTRGGFLDGKDPARPCGLATSTLCRVGEEAAQARDADRRQNSEGSKSSKSDTTFQIIIKAYLSGKDKLA